MYRQPIEFIDIGNIKSEPDEYDGPTEDPFAGVEEDNDLVENDNNIDMNCWGMDENSKIGISKNEVNLENPTVGRFLMEIKREMFVTGNDIKEENDVKSEYNSDEVTEIKGECDGDSDDEICLEKVDQVNIDDRKDKSKSSNTASVSENNAKKDNVKNDHTNSLTTIISDDDDDECDNCDLCAFYSDDEQSVEEMEHGHQMDNEGSSSSAPGQTDSKDDYVDNECTENSAMTISDDECDNDGKKSAEETVSDINRHHRIGKADSLNVSSVSENIGKKRNDVKTQHINNVAVVISDDDCRVSSDDEEFVSVTDHNVSGHHRKVESGNNASYTGNNGKKEENVKSKHTDNVTMVISDDELEEETEHNNKKHHQKDKTETPNSASVKGKNSKKKNNVTTKLINDSITKSVGERVLRTEYDKQRRVETAGKGKRKREDDGGGVNQKYEADSTNSELHDTSSSVDKHFKASDIPTVNSTGQGTLVETDHTSMEGRRSTRQSTQMRMDEYTRKYCLFQCVTEAKSGFLPLVQYKCIQCPHKTKSKYKMFLHIRGKHIKEIRMVCPICLTFKSFHITAMSTHILTKHNVNNVNIIYCTWCNYLTLNKANLINHIRFAHKDFPTSIICRICYEFFDTLDYLQEHILCQHKEPKNGKQETGSTESSSKSLKNDRIQIKNESCTENLEGTTIKSEKAHSTSLPSYDALKQSNLLTSTASSAKNTCDSIRQSGMSKLHEALNIATIQSTAKVKQYSDSINSVQNFISSVTQQRSLDKVPSVGPSPVSSSFTNIDSASPSVELSKKKVQRKIICRELQTTTRTSRINCLIEQKSNPVPHYRQPQIIVGLANSNLNSTTNSPPWKPQGSPNQLGQQDLNPVKVVSQSINQLNNQINLTVSPNLSNFQVNLPHGQMVQLPLQKTSSSSQVTLLLQQNHVNRQTLTLPTLQNTPTNQIITLPGVQNCSTNQMLTLQPRQNSTSSGILALSTQQVPTNQLLTLPAQQIPSNNQLTLLPILQNPSTKKMSTPSQHLSPMNGTLQTNSCVGTAGVLNHQNISVQQKSSLLKTLLLRSPDSTSSQLQQTLVTSQLVSPQTHPIVASQLMSPQTRPIVTSQLMSPQTRPIVTSQLMNPQTRPIVTSQLMNPQTPLVVTSQLINPQTPTVQLMALPDKVQFSNIVHPSVPTSAASLLSNQLVSTSPIINPLLNTTLQPQNLPGAVFTWPNI